MIAMLADAFVKATVILLLAAGASLLLRRSAAALRHLVWALAFVGVLVLPVVGAIMPDWRLAAWPRLDVPMAVDAHQITTVGAPGLATSVAAPRAAPQPAAPTPPAAPTSLQFQLTPDWTAFVVPAWLAGVVLVLLTLALGLARIAWLGRTAAPLVNETWTQLARHLATSLGVGRRVRLLRSAGPAMPMTWGIWRPVILLPAEADTWPVEQRRDVLLHELAHVTRHDFITQLIARVACAVYWFNPLTWLAAGWLRIERERACDDHVLRAGAKPSAYASHLLEIARALRAAPATSLASVAMARPSQLATRLLDVLDATRRRGVVAPRVAVPAWIAAAVVVIPLAAVAPRALEPAPRRAQIDTIPERRAPVMKPTSRARPAPASVGSDTLKGCSRDTKHRSASTNQENDDLTILVSVGGCTVRLSATGKFTFNADYTDIATVAAGAKVVIEVDYGAHDYRLTVRPGAERLFKVDDETRPFDAEAKGWLAETITYLLRRTGYDGEARARSILERGGIQGLLTEIAQIQGDYARRIYYQAAIESGKLATADYERLVALAGQQIQSDYELAELLIAVAKARPLSAQMQTGFVTAAKNLQSDYERHRVLRAALARPDLTPAVEAAMLQAAAGIQSDYELASVLIELNAARPIDDSVRVAFFGAANSLQSDYEHRRVLTAVVGEKGPQASRALVGDVLTSAQAIASDYELAELLVGIGTRYPLDDALAPAFFAAATSIGSDYERARSLASLLDRPRSRAMTLALLESAKGIQSDHELSELLLQLIRKTTLDDTVRAAIRSAIGGIGSQYDRGRVFEALP